MALTTAQLIARACSKAKVPGYTAQGLQELNVVLGDLCQTYDLALARGLFTGTFPTTQTTVNGVIIFGGPITLPADYLRTSGSTGGEGAQKSVWWDLLGVQYPMVPCDLAEFDMQVQQAGIQSYPWLWATDMSVSPAQAWIYPPASGAYPFFCRYQKQMPDIIDTTTVPWFPNQQYLIDKVASRLMQDSDDSRALSLGQSADMTLSGYLRSRDDNLNRPRTVQLDRRNFGSNFAKLANTKTTGW